MKSASPNQTALKLTDEELASILGRHCSLLKELHPDKQLNLRELANQTGKDYGNLSKLITQLENLGVVWTREEPRDRGRPFRTIGLNSKVVPLLSSFIDAVRPEKEYDPTTIDLCLDVLEDDELDDETRGSYAEFLHSKFTSIPAKILTEHKRLRECLEAEIKNPKDGGVIEERKRSMIKVSIPQLTMNEKTCSWVLDYTYPKILEIFEARTKPEKILIWTVSILEDIEMCSSDPEIRKKIKTEIRNAYFEDAKMESDLTKKLSGSILEMCSRETESTRELVSYLREKTKSSNKLASEKAKLLLKEIVKHLPR